MYHAQSVFEPVRSSAYLSACTSTTPTKENVDDVRSLATMLRSALECDDLRPLQQLVNTIHARSTSFPDLFAAAQFEVTESLTGSARSTTALRHDVHRISNIARRITPADSFAARKHDFAARLAAA